MLKGTGAMAPGPALLVARKISARKKKTQKTKRRSFYFKQKKETRRKGINASQLAIRDFYEKTCT